MSTCLSALAVGEDSFLSPHCGRRAAESRDHTLNRQPSASLQRPSRRVDARRCVRGRYRARPEVFWLDLFWGWRGQYVEPRPAKTPPPAGQSARGMNRRHASLRKNLRNLASTLTEQTALARPFAAKRVIDAPQIPRRAGEQSERTPRASSGSS